MSERRFGAGRRGGAAAVALVRMPRAGAALLTFVAASVFVSTAAAHDFTITDVKLVIRVDGELRADITCDLDELALGVGPQHSIEELARTIAGLPEAERQRLVDGLRDLFRKRVRLRFDGEAAAASLSLPELDQPPPAAGAPRSYFGTTARLSAPIPAGAKSFTFWASRAFQPVHLTVTDERTGRSQRQTLAAGEESAPYALGGDAPPPGRSAVAWQYLKLGFEHILPLGLDHILFVLGLYLLSVRWPPLLWQVTAFTAAHTTTLALAMYGVVRLPSSIVEPLIALSIAYVGIENLATSEMKPWRPVLVFGFGLLHGLGFAGVLTELGLPEGEFVTALVTFNVGVELGQLAVIGLAFAVSGWWRDRPSYRRRVIVPASVLIAGMGLYWAAQRSLGWG